jgi:hypothetical protein
VIQGTVVQTNEDELLVLANYGTVKCQTGEILSIKREPNRKPTTLSTNTVAVEQRIPDWRTVIAKLAPQVWSSKLRQIPATVITNGILRNVPYISFRCGLDYEVNIYGDLDKPAGVEVGMYLDLVSSDHARDNAINFLSSILIKETDQAAVKNLNRAKDVLSQEGLTFEITPATADDSYGGWWVSIYDQKALDQARVSDRELESITVLNSIIMSVTNSADVEVSWTKEDIKYARSSTGFTTQRSVGIPPSPYTPPATNSDYSSGYVGGGESSHNYDHGSVYVRGYTRKDGTYVHSYTRRR